MNDWRACTDRRHDSEGFYWYYWDPQRYGCRQKEGVEYQDALITLSNSSPETQQSFPEYQNMIRKRDGQSTLTMTFAFGYAEDVLNPDPDSDNDVGALEYQKFIRELRKLLPREHQELPIMKNRYPETWGPNSVIGKQFIFTHEGTHYDLKVVTNAGVDQMILFAHSYAKEQDSYFAWLGHSRVGSGFDAERFESLLRNNPNDYSIAPFYQLIYWGGCNSYSYYTEPFFRMKAEAHPSDAKGTKNLDIIAHGLPSYFSLNSVNALLQLKALLNLNKPESFQSILNQMETAAAGSGIRLLAVVLGDEDNSLDVLP
jgi:hypothetical protein